MKWVVLRFVSTLVKECYYMTELVGFEQQSTLTLDPLSLWHSPHVQSSVFLDSLINIWTCILTDNLYLGLQQIWVELSFLSIFSYLQNEVFAY